MVKNKNLKEKQNRLSKNPKIGRNSQKKILKE